MKVQVAAIIFTVILIGSATFLRSASDPNQLNSPLELTDRSVASALNNSSFIILDFYYPGCGPCKSMNNTTSELASELKGQARFARMNVRDKENSQTVKKYKISAYPTLLFFDEGILGSPPITRCFSQEPLTSS
jgi:thiol-disulfide isomerase/thioredoxin